MTGLSHTNRKKDFLLYAGARVLRWEGHEVKTMTPLVDRFVEAVGRGVMKTLLVDRGFIDGESIRRIKEKHGVDVVVPLKSNMDITEDAWMRIPVIPATQTGGRRPSIPGDSGHRFRRIPATWIDTAFGPLVI
jgi:hypothetical protein